MQQETSKTQKMYPVLYSTSSLKIGFGFGKHCMILITLLLATIVLLGSLPLTFDLIAVYYDFMAGLNGMPSVQSSSSINYSGTLFLSSFALTCMAFGIVILPRISKSKF